MLLRKWITYCLPTYSVRGSEPPQLFSNAEGERKHKQLLHCLLASKYVQGVILSFSFLGDTTTEKQQAYSHNPNIKGKYDTPAPSRSASTAYCSVAKVLLNLYFHLLLLIINCSCIINAKIYQQIASTMFFISLQIAQNNKQLSP